MAIRWLLFIFNLEQQQDLHLHSPRPHVPPPSRDGVGSRRSFDCSCAGSSPCRPERASKIVGNNVLTSRSSPIKISIFLKTCFLKKDFLNKSTYSTERKAIIKKQ
uniref:Uncharacterized protein n=1 Tax=Setaria viridis TaxID=4556 RepID=A0A4U6TZ97_SETVI|nr:hypothetical protein SEVIR_7G227900v2 [Setaria viridis]